MLIGSPLASYVLGGTGLISQTRGSTTSYFLGDGPGSTRALTSSTGTVTDTYSYTAFGEAFNSTGTTVNPYRYTGQQFDSLTGLYSLRARYYNPALGRFLSQDTYPVNFNNPVELNRYVYAANSPINLSDPTGKAALAEYSLLMAEVAGGAIGAAQAYICGGSTADIIESAALGVLLGFDFAAAMLTAPLAANAVGFGFGAIGAGVSIYDILENGWNACNGINLAFSLVGMAFAGRAMIQELSSTPPSRIWSGAPAEKPAPRRLPFRLISGGSGQYVIMELGVGRGKNLINLGRLFRNKAIIGVDIDTAIARHSLAKEGLDNVSFIKSVWDNVLPSSADEVISIAPGGAVDNDVLALRAATKAVRPGGKIYIGSLQDTFGNQVLPADILSALETLTSRGLKYSLEYTGKTGLPTGYDSWGYPLKTDFGRDMTSYLIVRVNP